MACELYEEAGGGGDGHKNGGLYTAGQHHAHQPAHAHPAGERRVRQRSSGKIRQKIRKIRQRNFVVCGLYKEAGGGGDGHKNGGLYTAGEYHAHQPAHAHPAGERRVGQRSSEKIRQKKLGKKSAKIIPRKKKSAL